MLSEEEVSSCIEGLIRLGVLESVLEAPNPGELVRFKVPTEDLVGRIVGGEFGEPPEGVELVPWFSCIMLKILIEERNVAVSRNEFIAMAAVMTGFMSEAAIDGLLTWHGNPVLSHRRPG